MNELFWIAVVAVTACLVMGTILFHNWEVNNKPWSIADCVGLGVMTAIYCVCSVGIVSWLSGTII